MANKLQTLESTLEERFNAERKVVREKETQSRSGGEGNTEENEADKTKAMTAAKTRQGIAVLWPQLERQLRD